MARADEIVDFWFGAPASAIHGRARAEWFRKDAGFDQLVRGRYAAAVGEAIAGAFDDWVERPLPALALVLLLDQFPRNIWRGTAAAFSGDAGALRTAEAALARGHDRALSPVQRWFLYLPFEHAEDLAAQRRSLALFESLADDPQSAATIDYARRHLAIIERFGRFPHRNAALGRSSTPEELAFLQEPGSAF